MTTKPLPPHGTYARARGNHRSGNQRCRCSPCRAAENAYTKRRKYLRSIGRPLLVDAAPVRAHLKKLRDAGDAMTVIAEQVGIPRTTMANITSGRNGRVRSTTAAAILAIRPGSATASNLSVPALGATRRLRALMALGHPLKSIAAEAGIEESTGSYLLNGHAATIHYELAQRVNRGYRSLSTRRGTSVRSLRRAEREGWAPPAAWNDEQIDDPVARPEQPEEMGRRELAAYRRAEIQHLASFGIPEREIAARLDLAGDYVHDLLRNMRQAVDAQPAACATAA